MDEIKKPKKKKVNITCSISVARINSHFSLFTSSYFAQVKELLVDELKQNKEYYSLINTDSIYFDAESPYHADDELHIVFKCGFNGRVGNKTKSKIKSYIMATSLPLFIKTTKRLGELVSGI